MKAQIAPRIDMENRTRLETVIPLPQPFVVFVDPASVCNFQCQFCANGDSELVRKTGRKQGLMDFELFTKVINDLGVFDKKIKVLRLYKEGEPLLHPRLPEMIKYAKGSGTFESIDLTTNGSLLKPQTSLALVEAGLDRINISVEAMSSEKYRNIAKVTLDFDAYVDNIRYLYEHKGDCVISIKTVRNYMEDGEEQKFYDIFGDITDLIFVENLAPCWPDFDMSAFDKDFGPGIYGQQIGQVEVCPYIFYSVTVNVDGSVSSCFLDWEHKLIIGDIRQNSFADIWNGEALRDLRVLHLQKKRFDNAVCRNCGQLVYGAPDNIDSFAEDLLRLLDKPNQVRRNL